ncbi:MAG: aminotransferase class I/II-fold pyridoxal phosphate-dependent enzyme [Actinomycetota bacterium]|nr:aminotransferase class I/II-fold pyridoxal phosphate-dependent enzyme [Actinomycetota bacterium]
MESTGAGRGAGPFDVDLARLRRRRTVKWSLYGPDVLAAWVAEMDFDVAPPVRDALLAAVAREDFGYVPADLTELTTACAAFLDATTGWQVPPSRVFPVADVLTGIAAAIDLYSPPGTAVVVPTPAYPPFFDVVALTGRPVDEAPMVLERGRWCLDVERIDRHLAAGARTVLLCSPHNPTGRVFRADELDALAEVVERHGARVVADEVHAPLVATGVRHAPYASVGDAAADHAVTITSASKAWNLAGLRCAQVIASNHDDAAAWRRLPLFAVHGPTPLGIAASTAAYHDGGDWLLALRGRLDENRRLLDGLLRSELAGVTWHGAEATFLAWLDCAPLGFADPARQFLDHGRVALSDGPPFGAGWEQHVRLNLGTSSELLERIVAAIARSLAA